jgi:hypothetical protein
MIRLKRNDKIIIIIAVAVIIVAAIGIAVYIPPEEEPKDQKSETMKSFTVDWEEMTATYKSDSGYTGKKAPYEDTMSLSQGNLKSIHFNLSWMDDKTFLGRLGRDTLTIEVTTPDGNIHEESKQSAGRAVTNIEFTINGINTMPSMGTIEAEDLYEAEDIVNQEPYYSGKWVNEEITINVYVNVGEILGNLRPRDKGNGFDLEITYNYYEPIVLEEEEIIETGSNDNFDDELTEEDYTAQYLSMVLGGWHRY